MFKYYFTGIIFTVTLPKYTSIVVLSFCRVYKT